ncbi:MAG: filamentous hemagglutinin N-terminal domain-containing protein [Simkaniaceae bacterium]
MKQKKVIHSIIFACSLLGGECLAENNCTVVAGDLHAFVKEGDGSMTITTGDKAIFEWDSLNIKQDQILNFVQEKDSSMVLNRITGHEITHIDGQLLSNGQVVLINSNGLFVGKNGEIETAGFIGSTLDIENAQFLYGEDLLFLSPGEGEIHIEGSIHSLGNDVYLLAESILNKGSIDAIDGRVGCYATEEILIKVGEDQKIHIRPEIVSGTIENSGIIKALSVELMSTSPYSKAVRNSGTIEAAALEKRDGRIYLVAQNGGVEHSGYIQAATSEGGGEVHLLGEEVYLEENSLIDVSHKKGLGHVLIGGSYKGQDRDIKNSHKTVVKKGSKILANSDEGSGGRVVIWSDGDTTFHGEVFAKSHGNGKRGGFCEVSGKESVSYRGHVDLRADSGECGQLLIDPKFVTISSNGSSPAVGNTFSSDPSESVTISGSDLSAAIDSAFVVIEANTDITVNDTVTGTTNGNYLSLSAGRSIHMMENANITLNNGDFNVLINDENCDPLYRDSGEAIFSMSSNAQVSTQGGNITIDLGIFGGESRGKTSLFSSELDAGGGNISITSKGYDSGRLAYGAFLNNALVQTSSNGTITFNCESGDTSLGKNMGLYLSGPQTQVSTEDGDLILVGTGYGSGSANQGIRMENSAVVSSTGSGGVALTGTGGAGTDFNMGIILTSGSKVSVVDGAVVFSGTGNGTRNTNQGVRFESAASIESTGIGASVGTITVTGIGSNGIKNNSGISFSGKECAIISVDGNIALEGTAGGDGTGSMNQGIRLESGGCIVSTGTGADSALITLTGQGGNGVDYNDGITLSSGASTIKTVDGDILLTGNGGGARNSNVGIRLESDAYLESTGVGISAGNVTLFGTGGDGVDKNLGVSLNGTEVSITTIDGNIDITGTGQGSGNNNLGVFQSSSSIIESTGSGSVNVLSNDA